MVRRAKKNTKRKPKKKRVSKRIAKIKTIGMTVVLGTLSAFGLWRCLDEDSGSPLDPMEEAHNAQKIDVGHGEVVDPTLLNEQKLLEEEMPTREGNPARESVEKAPKTLSTPSTMIPEEETAETRFGLHAVAYQFHTQIRSEPNTEARVIGYARRGAVFRSSERISKKGCPKGWHELAPGGLFICDGQGVNVSDRPVTFSPSPPPPALDAPLPYAYSYVTTDNTPEYWRLPTPPEVVGIEALFERIVERDQAQSSDSDGGPQQNSESTEEKSPNESRDGGTADPYALPSFVHLRMAKGYYVSTDDIINNETGRFRRTIRGRFVSLQKLAPATPSSFEGFLIDDMHSLPKVFVVGGGVRLLRESVQSGILENAEHVSRLSLLDYQGEKKHRNRRFIRVDEGLFIPSRVAAVVRRVAPPPSIGPDERWIDVDLSEQTLVAYQGERPVFATLVSTGRPEFETPEGEFRIYSKHVSITMDDPDAGEESYSIEDVPWAQYFEEGYALHAAFWHDRYGRVRSHGCINLSPADARRLFFWTNPRLPTGMHGIASTRENPGTRVVIHK